MKAGAHVAWGAACALAWWGGRHFAAAPSAGTMPVPVSSVPPAEEKPEPPVPGDASGKLAASVVADETEAERRLGAAERAAGALSERNEFKRLQLFHRALRAMRPEDAGKILELFRAHDKEGRWFVTEYHYFLRRWGEVDGGNAIRTTLEKLAPGPANADLLRQVLGGWASEQPEAVAEWVNAAESLPEWVQDTAIDGLVDGLAKRDLEMAGKFVESRVDDPGRQRYFSRYADELLHAGGLNKVTEWYRQLPETDAFDEARGDLMAQIADRKMRADPREAAAFIGQEASQHYFNAAALRPVVDNLAQSDPAFLREWAQQLPPGAARAYTEEKLGISTAQPFQNPDPAVEGGGR